MPNCVEDLQMLRLTKAFQKLTDPDARRGVLFYVEEQVEKQREKVSSTPGHSSASRPADPRREP
jgi:hypothetical protein